jgi:hypothetical protein
MSSLERWLTKQPCALPCFEGITVGITDLATADQLLNANPFVIDKRRVVLGADVILWRWKDERYSSSDGVDSILSSRIEFEAGQARALGAYFPSGFTLAEVEKAYGTPTHVYLVKDRFVANQRPESYGVLVVYLNNGFFIPARLSLNALKDPLSFALPLRHESFYVFGKTDYFETTKGFDKNRLVKWSKDRSFADYCMKIFGVSDCSE